MGGNKLETSLGSETETYLEFKLHSRTIFSPKSNTVITGKGKEHTEDSERVGIDTWKKDGEK